MINYLEKCADGCRIFIGELDVRIERHGSEGWSCEGGWPDLTGEAEDSCLTSWQVVKEMRFHIAESCGLDEEQLDHEYTEVRPVGKAALAVKKEMIDEESDEEDKPRYQQAARVEIDLTSEECSALQSGGCVPDQVRCVLMLSRI